MDVNSRDPSQNIIPFRIKGVEVGRFDICGNLGIGTTAPTAILDVVGNVKINGELYVNGNPLTSLTSGVVVNMDSQPVAATALNRQKKQSIPLAAGSTLATSDIVAKMSGVSVGKTQVYGVGPAQMATYGNIVVAVGEGTNSIAYSLTNPPTAASWVGIPNSANTFTTQGYNIAYANGTWVAVGTGTNSIAYSTMTPPVASSWVGIPHGTSINGVVNTFTSSGSGRDIVYANGAWVAVGFGTNSIAYSLANPPTAESWVAIPHGSGTFGTAVYGIVFGNGTWVATGLGTNGIAYSTRTPPTADSWVVVPLSNVNDAGVNNTYTTIGNNIIYANGVWLAAGQGTNTLCYSVENPPIAGSWMPITIGVLFGTTGRSLAYGNGTWVACGESGALLAYSTARIPHSSSWVSMKGPTPSSSGQVINHISFNSATNTWYFTGDIGSNCMFYSTATPPVPATWIGVPRSAGTFTTQAFGAVGITTNAFTSPINVARLDNKVTFPANRMIAVGGGGGGVGGSDVLARSTLTPSPNTTGTISYSDDDGVTWAMVPGGATNAMFSSTADIAANTSFGVGGSRGANAVAWNGEKWVAAGNGRTNSLAFSDDGGMTWNGITGKSIFSVEARDVAWNGRMWVAVGRGVVFSTAYSYDGVTWMGPVTDDISGTPINVFSYEIAGPSAASSDISGGGNHVIWTGKMWVATGTRTLIAGSSPAAYYTVAYSMDGKSWTGVPESGATSTGFDIYAHGIAWNGRNFVATGRGTVNTLAFSTDATATWQGLGNSVFSVWGRGITWGARRWMATGRGTNTVAYSTNGRNWQGCGANVFKPMRRFMALGDTGLYTTVSNGQPQRGVAFSYSDDGITWDAPVVNQTVEFSTPLGGTADATRSVVFTNNILLTNAITDTATSHTALMFSSDGGASWSRVPGSSDTEANGGTGMTAANGGSYSLAMNPARTRFIVGGGDAGSVTKKVYFSNDGFNWRNGVSSPNATQMAWVHSSLWVGGGYNRWLVGGSDAGTNANGRIMYSGDADALAAWVPVSPATYTATVISCFAANTDFSVILAGALSGNVIYRSVNGGANWTTVSISGTPTGSVMSIAFSPALGRWVAVGGGSSAANTIIYSTDATGSAWIAPPLQAKTAATAIFKNGSEVSRVIWDAIGARFIVGGWNGAASTAALTNVFGLDATLNNNPGYTMAYSADGINWTPVTVRSSDDTGTGVGASPFGPFLTRCREIMALDVSGDFTPINTGYTVTWNSYANRFVATGNGTSPVVYSNDGGVTWTPANQQPPQQAIVVAGGASAAANTTSVSPITYTIDGKTWFQGLGAKEAFGTSGTVIAVRYGQTSTAISPNGRIWVAGGTGTSSLAFSQNGIRWTPVANATTMMTNVRAIAYAAPAEQMNASAAASGVGNGVWVAGGDTTNSLVFSYDGISWSEVPNSLTILSRCNAIAYGGAGVFVAGGLAGTIDPTANMAYSTDGYNWQPIRGSGARISGGGASINCITYGRDENGRGLWVAGAFGSSTVSIMYSYNGIDWVGVVGSGGSLSSTITGLAYGVNSTTGRGLWVASVYQQTGAGYSFLFSANGRDGWTAVANTKAGLFEVNTSGATSIAYLNGVWYATGLSAGIGTGRTLAYSYEGSSGWFGVYPTTNLYGTAVTTYSATSMLCVATTGDFIIPTGAGASAALTPMRGLGWTAGVGSAYLQHPTIVFGATGGAGAEASTDGGRSWGASTLSLARSAFRGGVCNDAFWNGIVWAAVGYDAVTGAKVATSKDGVTWTQIPGGSVPIAGVLYSIMWNGSVWMVGGDGSPTNDANTVSIAWSADLAAWTGIANTDTKLRVVKRIAWNGMYWVAVGAGDVSTIMHSRDRLGLVWEDTYMSGVGANKTAAAMSAGNDVVWGGGHWVAVGRANNSGGSSSGAASIIYSVDTPAAPGIEADYAINGRRWTAVVGSAQLFPYGVNSISWNGKRFIATGPASGAASTGNIIAWSADGMSWTAYSSAKTVAPGQRWVAVGSGSRACIALSADGRVWTDVSGSAVLFPDISGANAALVSTMKTGGRAIGWNGSSLVAVGARAATTVTASTTTSAATMATTGRTTIPVCAFIGSGNGVMGGGTTNAPMDATAAGILRTSSSVFITHMDVNMRESSAPWANMWLNTYTDLSGTQLFQVTPETQTFSSALKWNGWSWVANFGMTTFHPQTGEQYGSIWYCSDPLARVGWSVASNSIAPRILIGQGGYAALEWNGVAWLACGYDPNNNNLIYTTDKYGAMGWTAVSGTVSGAGSASFQPVCIASSSRFWVVGGSQGAGASAIYYTSDRTGATGWRAVTTTGVGASVLPASRITSMGYNGSAWICCGGGRVGTDSSGGVFHSGSISWRADPTEAEDFATGWTAATVSGSSGGIPPIMSASSAIATNAGAGVTAPIWVVVGEDLSGNGGGQIAYTTDITGSSGWKKPATGTLPFTTFGRLNGIAWTGYSWIATSGAGFSRLASTTDPTAATGWNNTTNGLFTPTLSTNAVAFVNIPISLLTTGMPSSAGAGAGTGAMWRAGAGRAQGLLPSGGTETTSVVVRSSNGAEGTSWSQTYSRNFLIAVGGGVIRDASGGGGANRMAFSYDGGLSWTTNTSTVLTNAVTNAIGTIRTVKYGNGMWVAGGDAVGSSVSGNNCLAWSRDGVNWTGAGGTQIFGSAGACYAVCCNDRGRWVAVGGAPLGTVGTYTNTSGSIYTMAWSDDGMNWTPILGSRALFGIVCQGVSYGADASGVGMWTAIGRGTTYTGCAYSYDGKTWFLSQTSGSLFTTSVNVLTERYAPVAADWRTVAINSTGQIQFAGANGGLVWRSMDYGVTWSALTLPSRAWVSVAVSSTGQYVVAASSDGSVDRLYNSSDYGATWVARGYGSSDWKQVAISATGQYQVGAASSLSVQISRDYGVTWVVPTTNGGALPWTGIAISSSGQYITAVGTPIQVHQSSDYGVSFTLRSTNWNWLCVAMSSTGQIQIGSSHAENNIYVSTDYGVIWTSSNSPRLIRYRSVAISSTGQYRSGVMESTNETIKRSNNYDAGWSTVGVSTNYFAIAMSATGQYQTAVSQTSSGLIFISSNFGETWSAAATDSRSLGVAYGKDASGVGMWVATAGRRDRDISATAANTMAYSYDGKLWRGITASAGLSEQAWSVAYGKDGFGVGMWVAAGYDTHCGLKWSYDGVTWNATMGASGAAVWAGMAAGRRALTVYWNGSMWLASTSDTRNGEPRGTSMAVNNASSVPGYLLYSYNGKNWLPVLAPNTYGVSITGTAQASVYSVLPNPAILDFGSFYDDQSQRGVTIANTTARTVGAVMSGGVPIENVNTIVPYGRGSLTTGQVPFLLGGDSGLVDTAAGVVGIAGAGAPPPTSDLVATTASLSTSTDGGITWRAVPNSTRVMTKVNKILCDETTQQIVAVGTGNYSVATSTPSKAADADGWTGVFGSRMTDTRAGLFEKYGTGASWFSGAKMWIASGRAQSRRGSSLAVSVNGTVWQDAKIVSQVAAGTAGARGGGLTSRTTTGGVTIDTTDRTTLYTFTAFTFDNAGATGRTGPDLSACRTRYATTAPTATWAQDTTNKYLDMSTNGIQLWTVPATGTYTIRAVGAAGGTIGTFGRGRDIQTSTVLTKGEVIKILVGQKGTYNSNGSGGGGTFVVRGIQTPIIVAGGGGGRGGNPALEYINSNASSATSGNKGGDGSGTNNGAGGIDGAGGSAAAIYAAGGGGLLGAGGDSSLSIGGASFISGGAGGTGNASGGNGGFGGGGGSDNGGGGGGGGGYSGGGGGRDPAWASGGGGGSFAISTMTDAGAINTGQGSVTITFNNFIITNSAITPLTFTSSVIPYTAPSTPLLTYTDSAAAFSTQVGSVAVNSQYNRAVVGGSGVQFVAGGRGGTGLVASNDGQNWTAAAAGTTTTVFQSPTNTTTRTGSGGFDASFGTVALTQRLTTPATYLSTTWRSVSISSTGQYQTAVVPNGQIIYTSSDYGINWTPRDSNRNWFSVSISSTGQYQTAVVYSGGIDKIFTSSDYGINWTPRDSNRNWVSVSISSTGQYQTAVVPNGQIYTSSDYGINWTPRDSGRNWYSVSISSTGQYQTAVVSGGQIYTSSDYGVSWTPRDSNRNWVSVSISSTGQYQTAVVYGGLIYISSDYGINWTPRDSGRNWYSVSLSSTGQYQTAVVDGFQIYTSSDYGAKWTPRDSNRVWRSVSLSSTGQYQTAVVQNGHIYTSTDFGVTWVQRSTATRTNAFTRIKSSASGQYQLATSGPVGDINGQLYVSSDYGQTWMPRCGLATWLGGAVSATGGVMMAMTSAPPTIIKLNNALSYSPILYLDATNPSSYNVSTNTWTNLGSLGGNVLMTNMGSFDVTDNGGAFNFNGSSNYGTLSIASTSLTQITYVGVVKPTSSAAIGIISFGNFNPYFYLASNQLGFYSVTPTYRLESATNGTITTLNTWYHLAVTVTSTGSATFYINGVSSGTATGSAATWTQTSFGIGAATNGQDKFTGKISSVAAYNRVLTASEIYNLYFSSALIRSTDYGNTFTDIPNTTLTFPSYWRAIAATNSAAIQTALAHGSTIYRSTDYGSTWNSSAVVDVVGILTTEFSSVASPTLAWKSIAMSADAKYQTGVVSGSGQIYVNSNYGREAWTGVDSGRNWASVSMSADGRYQSAVVTSGAIYYNSTSGTGTWTAVSSPAPGFAWTGIAVSSADGKYQTAVASGATNIYVNSNFGVGTWTAKESARNWFGVAMSATGQYQTAINRGGFIYIDASFGTAASWTQVDSQRDWASVAMSSTGQYQTAVVAGGKIYANSNYGAHGAWTETDENRAWISVAVSGATGRYQTAVAQNAQIYINSNFGAGAWTAVDSSRNWVSVTVSSDGKYQSAAVATSGQVYFSRDYGATWSTTAGLDIMGNRWQDVAIAAETGAVQVTCVSGGYLYVSSDTGANWVSTTVSIDGVSPQATNRAWQAVAVSANGQYGLACVNSTTASGFLYRSTDAGASWSSSNIIIDGSGSQATNRAWQDVGMSANGKYQVACLNSITQTSSSSTITSAVSVMVTPPGALTPVYGAGWPLLGPTIPGVDAGEQSGISVSLSADGTTVAIGAYNNSSGKGITRIYKYNATTNTWPLLGPTIPGVDAGEQSGYSVSLSADGTTVAIGAYGNSSNKGITRVHRIPVYATPTYSISNPAIADIYANTVLLIKDGASGTATITATQPATPPFTAAPVTVEGTLDVSGTTYTLVYNTIYPIFTPFPGAVAGDSPCVAYGRAGSQGTGAPLWTVGGAGGTNVFAMSSAPTTIGAWSVVASNAPSANVPFPTCNSIAYSNGVWVAGNNTGATNILARSTDGGSTWTPITASSVSGIIVGAAALGANAFCNYSLAVADFSNDTNLRSWVAVQGTKNFFFEGGVSAVATVTPDVSAAVYNAVGGRAWWVAGGVGLAGVASIGSTTDPSGATGWTKSTSPAIANLAGINAIAFSPFTQGWLAVGAGATGSLGTNVLTSDDSTGATWTAGAVTSALTPVITLNTCVWNQPPASASSAGRWLAAGTRAGGVGADSASLYISTDASGAATPWTPITGTGAILSHVYSLAYNGQVWIAAGAPATDNGSTSTLMRTADPAGTTGWHSIPVTNISTSGFDTAARSVTWNADQQMWVATGENTGSAADASFSSVIYSRDINGAAGTWRTVRESNSACFSGEGTGIAFTGDKWFAVGDNGNVVVATSGTTAANAGATTTTWTPITHGTALTRVSDIAYTGRRLVATGTGTGAASGIIYSSDGTGDNGTWLSTPAGAFTDASGGGTSVTFEASYEGTGRLVATGRSATNALSISTDGGVSWTAPSVQYSSTNTFDTTTTPLFTTGGNSVAYVGNDTLFAGGGNDVHWTGKRWVAVGKNSAAAASAVSSASAASAPDVVNNNTIPIATSDDGITWQCVRTSQAPNLTEGAFIGTNSRIGATPLINSQIVITDGGDTEGNSDYGGMGGGGGGSGTGVAQIDIIAELTPVSNAAASVVGTVGVIGAAGNGVIGHVTTPSFDNTAFTITTRPM